MYTCGDTKVALYREDFTVNGKFDTCGWVGSASGFIRAAAGSLATTGLAAVAALCLLSLAHTANLYATREEAETALSRHPLAPTWPLELVSIFRLEELPGGKTKFTVTWRPHNATGEERKAFDGGHQSMQGGWTGTLDQFEAYLAKTR